MNFKRLGLLVSLVLISFLGLLGYTNIVAVSQGGTGATTASAARTNLGLGSIATQASDNVSITGGSVTGITDLAVADGGTGASTAAGARDNIVFASAGSIACASPCTPGTGITVVTMSGTGTVNLPALSGYVDGRILRVVNDSSSTATITLDPSDSGTLDGGSAGASAQYTVLAHGVVGAVRTSATTWGSVQPGGLTANGARIAINSGTMQARSVYVWADGTTTDLGPWVSATTGGTDQATLSGSDLVVSAGAATATTAPGTNGERWTWLLSDLGLTVPSGVGAFSGVVNCTSMSDGARVASSTMVVVAALGTGATTPNRFFGFSRQASSTTYGYAIGATTGTIFQNAVSANLKRVRGDGPYQTTTSLPWITRHFTAAGVLDASNPTATVTDVGLSGALTTLGVYAQRTGSATSTTDWTIAGFTAVMTWSAL